MTAMIDTIGAVIVVTVLLLAVIGILMLLCAAFFAVFAIAKLAIQSYKGGKSDCDRELLP